MPVEIRNLDGKVILIYEADTLVKADLKRIDAGEDKLLRLNNIE